MRPVSANQLVRRLEDTPTKGLAIDITARLNLQEQAHGTFLLEVEPHKHRMFLVPSCTDDGPYAVWAEIAPAFTRQR
jgi:hypothetical protein